MIATPEELADLQDRLVTGAAPSRAAIRHDWNGNPLPVDELDRQPAHKKGGFHFVRAGDLEFRPPKFLIDGLLETETLSQLFGEPGCGKSFIAVDIALSVATGASFHGRSVRQGTVFFIAGEGHNGLARRFAAWSAARGVCIKTAPLFKSDRAAQFLDPASARDVAGAAAELAAQHGDPALIVLDTLARNFGPGDENSTSDMSKFVAAIDDLKAGFPGCAVLIVHHSGHAEKGRARGSMALKGALDAEFHAEMRQGTITLSPTKMKDAEPPSPLAFALKTVALPEGASSAVLEQTAMPERQNRLTKAQALARDTFISAAAVKGIWSDDGFTGLRLEDWRDAFYGAHTGDNAEAKKKAFQRVRADLQGKSLISAKDDIYHWSDDAIESKIALAGGRGTYGT